MGESWVDLFEHLHDTGAVVLDGPRVRLPDFEVTLDASQQALLDQLQAELQAAGLEGLKYADALSSQPDLLHLMLGDLTVTRVGDHVLWAAHLTELAATVKTFLQSNGQMHPADFKAMTGLSRRHAIPLLEWLDSKKVTVRSGDARVAGTA